MVMEGKARATLVNEQGPLRPAKTRREKMACSHAASESLSATPCKMHPRKWSPVNIDRKMALAG